MKKLNLAVAVGVVLSLDLAVSSCGQAEGTFTESVPDWPHFKASTLQEDTGEFVVDGDSLVQGEPALRDFSSLRNDMVGSPGEGIA